MSKQRAPHEATPANIGTLIANAKLMPTREATKVGTLVAWAKLMPTRGASKVGTGFARGVNLGPKPQNTHGIKCKIHVDRVCGLM